jgi:hypothetical protein
VWSVVDNATGAAKHWPTCYYQDEPLTRDEVRRVAANIRKLLDLSRIRGRALTIQRGPA